MLALLVVLGAATAADPWRVGAGAGAVGVFDAAQDPWGLLEARPPQRFVGCTGWVMALGGAEDLWVGAGIRAEVRLPGGFRAGPAWGPGWYTGRLGLGSPFEMRTALGLSWTAPAGWEVAVTLHHLSSARLTGSTNPGAEILTCSVLVPLR
jgi:hypothetical protein